MNDFETVKSKLPIADVVKDYGGQRKKNFVNPAPCCGHNDCFSIDEEQNLWKCFSCGKGGSVIDLVMAVDECDAAEALRRCADKGGIELDKRPQEIKEKTETPNARMYRIAAQYYHEIAIKDGSQCRTWFCNVRGHSENTLTKMRVGWSDGELVSHLRQQTFTPIDCVNLALALDKSTSETINIKDVFPPGRAIFPIINHDGTILNFTAKDPAKKFPGLMLKGIKKNWFINHLALGKYQHLFVVEGENDVASLLDIECNNVVGTAGGPSKEQVLLIKNLCVNQTVYLWFDKDPEKDPRKNEGGPHHTRFFYKELIDAGINVRIVNHPGDTKDPDEYIQILRKQGFALNELRKVIKELKENALEPLAWEIKTLEGLTEAKDRLDTIKARQIPQLVNSLSSKAEQEIYINLIAKSVGISEKAAESLVGNAHNVNLRQELNIAFGDRLKMQKEDGIQIAEHIYKWFSNGANGRFFKTSDKKNLLFFKGNIIEIGRNPDFDSLMLNIAYLTPIEKPGPVIWHALAMLCAIRGEYVDMTSWIFTDKEKDIVFINLNSKHNKIIKLQAGQEPILVDNGTNEESILLSSSQQTRTFDYHPNIKEAEGFAVLKALIMDTIPIERPQKYFFICWLISIYMMNYQGDRALIQVVGNSALGKSKVLERISQLIYGENYSGRGTGPADIRIATKNPVIFQDNIENKHLTQDKVDFLLFLANSARKPKAMAGSDTDIVYQKLDSMGMASSIEAFPGKIPELLNRTFQFWLDKDHRKLGYNHDDCMGNILKQRNIILSSILKLISKSVLPNLSARPDWAKYINIKFPNHNKERNNEHICTMVIILEAILEYIPYSKDLPVKKQASEIIEHWLTYQEDHAKQIAVTSNTLLTLMNGLVKEIRIKLRGRIETKYQTHPEFTKKVIVFDDPEYREIFYLSEPEEDISEDDDENNLTCLFEYVDFITTSADLYIIFNRYCANQHIKNPYDSPNALGARISNDKEVMEHAGWKYITKKNDSIKYKTIMGQSFWRFSKKLKVIR